MKNMKKIKTSLKIFSPFIISFVLFGGAFFANAQTITPATAATPAINTSCSQYMPFNGAEDIFGWTKCFIGGYIVPIIFGLAFMFFLYGVMMYVKNAANEAKRKEGTNFMIYGIISLFVMVSLWGLVSILTSTFGFNDFVPQIQKIK